MNRKLLLAAAVAALGVESASAIQEVDLTTGPDAITQINGAYFFNVVSRTVSGTGVFNTFLAAGDGNAGGGDDIAVGFNSSSTSLMPEVDDSKTFGLNVATPFTPDHKVLVPAPNNPLNGVNYYSFGFDINEPNSPAARFLSLDELEVWVKPTTGGDIDPANLYSSLSGATGAVKVYDLDEGSTDVTNGRSLLLDNEIAGSGSGEADLVFLLPQSNILNVPGLDGTWFVYFYFKIGEVGTSSTITPTSRDYGDQGGFSEWQTLGGFNFTIIPEAESYAAMGVVGLAAAGVWRRSRRSKA